MSLANHFVALALSAGLMLCPLRALSPATLAVPFWSQVDPVNGLTWSVAVHPQHPEIVFVGTEASGLYRSGDSGAHWNKVGLELDLQYAYFPEVIFDPQTPDTMYAVAWDVLIKSTDAGNHWAWLVTDTPGNVVSLAINPHDSNLFYLTRMDGFYTSVDGGTHFTKTGTGLPAGYLESVTVAGPTGATLLIPVRSAGGLVGVYRSTDGGSTWAAVQGLPIGAAPSSFLADPADQSTIYAASNFGLYKSGDSGEHWAAMASAGFCISHHAPLAAGPGPALFAGLCDGVLRSTDSGVTWSRFGVGAISEVSALAADPSDGQRIWAATRNGLWGTKPGHALFLPLTQHHAGGVTTTAAFPEGLR